jgi:hypothetical protein
VLVAQQTRPNQQDPNPGGVPLFKDKLPSKEEGPSRVVRGAVVDEAGQPVAGAVVKLEDSKTGSGRNALTPKDGTWVFDRVFKNRDYKVKAEHEGKSSTVRTISTFDSRDKIFVRLQLEAKKAEK